MRFAFLGTAAAILMVAIGCRMPAPATQTTVPVNVAGFVEPVDAYIPASQNSAAMGDMSGEMQVLGHARGESPMRVDILSIIPLGELNLDDAVSNAIAGIDGAVGMINVRTHQTAIPLGIVALYVYHVEGTAIGMAGGMGDMGGDDMGDMGGDDMGGEGDDMGGEGDDMGGEGEDMGGEE